VAELMKQGIVTPQADKRREIYSAIQKIAMEDLPNIWVYSDNVTTAYKKYVKGFKLDPLWTKRMDQVDTEK
jgi:ABC-type transport system substrate-binding protein